MNLYALAPGISEDVFQSRIIAECRLLGLGWHHETDSRKTRAGWLDLFIVGPGGYVLAELKRQEPKYRATPEQAEWLARLVEARGGVIPALWRPNDFPHIVRVLHRLAGRPIPSTLRTDQNPDTIVDRYRLQRRVVLVGDFSTRRDAEDVRTRLANPDEAEVVHEAPRVAVG